MNYTENYQLPQWEENDRVLMADFNAAMSSIEAAILSGIAKAKTFPACVTGGYEGTGAAVTVELGFCPSFLVIIPINKTGSYSSDTLCLMGTEEAMIQLPRYSSNSIYQNVVFEESGFTVPADSGMVSEGVRFSYAAFY